MANYESLLDVGRLESSAIAGSCPACHAIRSDVRIFTVGIFMVLNACDSDSLTEPVERVSPSFRTVTQSPRAMNESSYSTRGQRKYRTTRLADEDEVERSEDEPRIGSPTSMSTHREPAEGSGEMSPRIDSDGSSSSGAKKKGLQKLASGAIANIGSVFRGGVSGESEGRSELSAGKTSRNATKGSSYTPDLALDSDPGMQEKLSPSSHKERFFQKAWRNRLKVIPNAGNALWIPQV